MRRARRQHGRGDGCDGAEEDVADEPDRRRHRHAETRHAREEQAVRHPDHVRLVALLPADAMVDRGSHQQDGRDERAEQAGVEDDAKTLRDVREAGRERHGEQEGEQELRSRKRDAQLVEDLDELAVGRAPSGLGPRLARARSRGAATMLGRARCGRPHALALTTLRAPRRPVARAARILPRGLRQAGADRLELRRDGGPVEDAERGEERPDLERDDPGQRAVGVAEGRAEPEEQRRARASRGSSRRIAIVDAEREPGAPRLVPVRRPAEEDGEADREQARSPSGQRSTTQTAWTPPSPSVPS